MSKELIESGALRQLRHNNDGIGELVFAYDKDIADREFARLAARIAELEQNAARYLWLRDKANHAHGGRAPMVFNCDTPDTMEWHLSRHGAELDAAVDVAMERWPVKIAAEKEQANGQ